MVELPDPLKWDLDTGMNKRPIRILSDKGIRQAFDLGLIKTCPSFDYTTDIKRIQPATLDVRIKCVDSSEPIHDSALSSLWKSKKDKLTLPAKSMSDVQLTELIDIGQYSLRVEEIYNNPDKERLLALENNPCFISVMSEVRSSVRRLGVYLALPGYFFSDAEHTYLEIGNFTANDIHFEDGERIAQIFFIAEPFADYASTSIYGREARALESGEIIRSLDMGVEVKDNGQLHLLQDRGFMRVSPELVCIDGMIAVHAGVTAYKMRMIEEGICFKKREQYRNLFEPVNITKGYEVKPYEHIVVDTREDFELSGHIGIRFFDSPLEYAFMEQEEFFRHMIKDKVKLLENMPLVSLTDGWIDPGYKGGFTRQPKWLTGRTIYPGDVIGLGQVFFFPNGVETSYGAALLGSQYQEK